MPRTLGLIGSGNIGTAVARPAVAAGWDAVDVGTLAESRRIEPQTPEGPSPVERFGWMRETLGVTVPAGGVLPEGLAFPERR
ncbi:hypothetical protein [Streptomyces acidiscabies]|uniref:hypothetical protein n=1 Tax=Streptomyces acidiscabies TaxID=42234 RepID=UPI0038F75A13